MRTSILAEVYHEVEISQSAVVRVGNRREIRMRCEIVGEQHHLVHQLWFGAFFAQSAEIVCIHGNDAIKGAKIFCRHGTRVVCECVATCCRLLAHAMIREFALVIVNHSCRIDGRKIGTAVRFLNFLAENFLSQRRAADIAQTNKENVHKCLVRMCLNVAQRYDFFEVLAPFS